jgi:hypothetical protein
MTEKQKPAVQDEKTTSRGKHTITTVIPVYVGNEETQREALLVLRRILMKYPPQLEDAREAEAGDG